MKTIRSLGMLSLLTTVLVLCASVVPKTSWGAFQESKDGSAEKKENSGKEAAAGDAAKGKEVFGENCAICHDPESNDTLVGPGLKGLFQWPPHKLSDGTPRDKETEESVRKQVVEGGGAMQPVGAAFSDEQLSNLIAYLKTL